MSYAQTKSLLQARGDDLVAYFAALGPGRLLTLVGVAVDELAANLPSGAPRMLRIDLSNAARLGSNAACVLDDLAGLALGTWPEWPQARLHSWGRAARRLASAGRAPLFRTMAPELQLPELLAAAGAPALLFQIDPTRAERAAPVIAALEWCRRHGAATVALIAEEPHSVSPWDRILYGALRLELAPLPVASRLVQPKPPDEGPSGSFIERRMRSALAADAELAGLFEDEVTVQLGPLGPRPRVDLLWRDGKVVVELDGLEHGRDPNYGADRHRDYELLVAGYLVLRLTNAEIALDLGRSIEKVRRVVNLRRE